MTSSEKTIHADAVSASSLEVLSDSEIEALTVTVDVVPDKPGLRGWVPTILFGALVVVAVLGVVLTEQKEMIAVWAVVLMLILMFMKVPVALALALPGLLGLYEVIGWRVVETSMTTVTFQTVASWSLSVLPMFIFMGLLLSASGLTSKVYTAARHWLGFLPGGLGIATNTAGTAFAAVSGSTLGVTYALARIGIPEMLRAGYDKRIAVGSIMAAGLPGQLIPPSTFLVIVAGLLESPVGPQLMAGIGPGFLVSIGFGLAIITIGIILPKWVGRTKRFGGGTKSTWGERWSSLVWIWPLVVLIAVIFGGIFTGILTATEAGAIGALGALIILLVAQRNANPIKKVLEAGSNAIVSIGAIFFLLVGAHILGQLLTVSGLGRMFATVVAESGLDRVQFLLLVALIFLILGMFMDPLAMLMLTLPFIIPMLPILDIDILWFGVFCVFLGEMAVLTPPVGMLSFVVHSLVQDKAVNLGQRITLGDVFKSVGLMLPVALVIIVVLILVPEIATFIPSLMAS